MTFPKLTGSQKKGYHGEDDFYIKEGKFMREFPIYEGSGENVRPTNKKRLLEYGLHGNSFTVKQLSKDSASVKETVAPKPEKKAEPEKKKTTGKKKKHKKEPVHKKKRRHRG